MGETAAGGSGWHPDPTGRAHLRYFDGTAWTESVSAWGDTWTDPIAPGPGRPDASLLALTSLWVDYGVAGLESVGRWAVLDASGACRGWIVSEVHPSMPRERWRFFVLDPADLVVCTLTYGREGSTPGLVVTDWRGHEHGILLSQWFDAEILVKVGGQLVARVDPRHGRPALEVDGTWDTPHAIELQDLAGTPVATVVNLEDRSWFRRTQGTRRSSARPDPARCRLSLERPAGVPEPFRTLGIGFVVLVAEQIDAERGQRRTATRRH